ncbi:MAG TPA: carboxypeptidase-like regulatory domain-containing protein, partial [Salinivirgaceae bacterium]|nr:carboxypeptidase-like regulatory domain-containing protein [Salinivirgaceae bacterium]
MKQLIFIFNRIELDLPKESAIQYKNFGGLMKTLLLSIGFLLNIHVMAQPPQAFNYQAAIRNASNQPLANATVTVRVSLLEGSVNGNVVYSEQHTTTTNAQGIVSLAVGMGNPKSGNFSTIGWAQNTMFIKI